MRRLGLIGVGGMSATVLDALATGLPAPLDHLALLARPGGEAKAEALLRAHPVARDGSVHVAPDGFLATRPDVVAECAGHGAVREHGAAVLRAGCDLLVISVGALADAALHDALVDAARAGGAQMILPPGAVGGLDVLAAARLSGLEAVTYTGRKPPAAWRGTAAEDRVELLSLREATVFFEGTAREAATLFPQNANVAAAVALAGLGFERTAVQLVADPAITRNTHAITARSLAGDFTIHLEGRPSPGNPKTSLTAGYSVARALLNRVGPVVV